jgi:uncharacterized protein (TIGR03790 family)
MKALQNIFQRGINSTIACIGLFLLATFVGCPALHAANPGDEVVVIYNSQVPESKDIAEHYAAMRHVPASHIFSIDIRPAEEISRTEFHDKIQKPLIKALDDSGLIRFGAQVIPATNDKPKRVAIRVTSAKIRYAVLCYGVPLKIAEDKNLHETGESQQPELRRNGAAVDSELACLPVMLDNMVFAGARRNPCYACTNASVIHPVNGVLIVARLDGPTPAIARALVDKALEAETNGLWGRAYFDSRGLTNGDYKLGDDWIRGAYEVVRRHGFESVLDSNPGTFPATFPLSQVAMYAGWYDEIVSGPFARPVVEFMPGAVAYHLHSFSAASLRTRTRQWVGPLLDRGVTATLGCVDEPYLNGTPDIATFFARLTYYQFTFGEAACAAQGVLSWQTTVVGDPLYRPFGRTIQQELEDLEARHSKLAEWAYLRLANLKLLSGTPMPEIAALLDHLPMTAQSAVLKEKLGELYATLGKPSSSVTELQQALALNPSPQQKIRIMLTLASRLFTLERFQEAYEIYQNFVKEFTDYADLSAIYRHLLELARRLNKKEDAEHYQAELNRLNLPADTLPTNKPPPRRKGP